MCVCGDIQHFSANFFSFSFVGSLAFVSKHGANVVAYLLPATMIGGTSKGQTEIIYLMTGEAFATKVVSILHSFQ